MQESIREGPETKPQKGQTNLRRFRRDIIINAATELFRKRGYNGVGMDEIGVAAGITGPGIYRHFKTKHDLLMAVIQRGTERLREEMRRATEEAKTPRDALKASIELTVAAAIEDRVLISAYYREHDLTGAARKRVHAEQRVMVDDWVQLLERHRPELTTAEARIAVLGIFGLIEAVGHNHGRLDKARLQGMMSKMAFAAIRAESSNGARGRIKSNKAPRSRARRK